MGDHEANCFCSHCAYEKGRIDLAVEWAEERAALIAGQETMQRGWAEAIRQRDEAVALLLQARNLVDYGERDPEFVRRVDVFLGKGGGE